MRPGFALLVPAALVVLGMAAGPLQAQNRDPNLGYLFPAGGQVGRTFGVLAGGQRLRNMKSAIVTGGGVEVEVVKYYRPVGNINGDERRLLVARLQGRKNTLLGIEQDERELNLDDPTAKIPEHPLLDDLDRVGLRGVELARRTLLETSRNQLNPQIAEAVTLRVKIAPDATPGDRTIRLVGREGVTNPVRFQVGTLRERREMEPDEPGENENYDPIEPAALPVVLNGQIMPGDVDLLRFRAKAGQSIIVDASARQLIPYLADAVPGWFQIVVGIRDSKGRELAYADDFRFHPDPLIRFEIPQDGVYQLEVHDSIYRGREDFVYRIRVGELPIITDLYPLGVQRGKVAEAMVQGWNLLDSFVKLNGSDPRKTRDYVSLTVGGIPTNRLAYAIGEMPEIPDTEPNNDIQNAQSLGLPAIVNGRIDRPLDVDAYRFEAKKGQKIVAEVEARRLGSPLDSKLMLYDQRGFIVAHNDDYMEKDGHLHVGEGLITHHADSYLRAKIPEDGSYYFTIADAQSFGSLAHAYRLRISEPMVDFRAKITPSSIARGRSSVSFYVNRRDGFDGEIDIEVFDSAQDITLHGATVDAGTRQIETTLSVPWNAGNEPMPVRFLAKAKSADGRIIEREVEPVDNRMQAFLWRHLVPTEAFYVVPR